MKQNVRARRVGLTSIALALVMRLFAEDVPRKLMLWLTQPETAPFLIFLETGRDVRFSPSLDTFSPDFMESPPPSLPQVTEPPIPSFSDSDSIELFYAAKKDPDIQALLQQPLSWQLHGEAPTVLILHTHTTESYSKTTEHYEESAAWRTLEEEYNMLSIGALVARILEDEGIAVVQDRQLHDYPSYNGSYADARAAIKAALEQYPSIQLVLDLHRDASGTGGSQMRTKAVVDGKTSAQLMVVIGTNHEDYEENLSLGLKLHAQLETMAPGIMRPLQLRAQRFNQDLSSGALLIEVGAAGNTHTEARLAAQTLARAVLALARGTQ